MRGAKVVLMMFLIGVLFGCPEQTPPAESSQPLAKVSGPSKGEVDIEFRGLVASVFIKTGKYVQSVFLDPGGSEEHKPLTSITSEWIDDKNTTDPDFVATGPADAGLAVWGFTEASIDPSNVSDESLTYDDGKVDSASTNYDLIRWVPSMYDIFGATQVADKNKIAIAAARGEWHVGTLTPIFDRPVHKTDKWDIGSRTGIPLADGVRLRLKLKDAGNPLVLKLKLKRTGTEEQIQVKGGGTILMSAYPTTLPKSNEDLKHFHHFYSLIKIGGITPSAAGAPTPFPGRCAPVLFFPPEDPQ